MMKGKYPLLVMATTAALLVAGCDGSQKVTSPNDRDLPEQSEIDESTQSVPEDTIIKGNMYPRVVKNSYAMSPLLNEFFNSALLAEPDRQLPTVEEVCNAYLVGDKRYVDYYQEDATATLSKGWITLCLENGSMAIIYPKAVCRQDRWTAESILTSYRSREQSDNKDPWVKVDTSYQLWSRDYQHCFVADEYSGWLLIDHVRALPLAEKTHVIEPLKLVEAYQSGEWNGERWFSEGYGTSVEINPAFGVLSYSYEAFTYSLESDPNGIAYTDYDPLPAFMTGDKVIHGTASNETLSAFDVEEAEAILSYYVDLPNGGLGLLDSNFISERINYDADKGTYLLTSDGITLYKKGKIVQSWPCEAQENGILATEVGLAFLGDRVVKLEADGSVTECVTDVIDVRRNWYFGNKNAGLTMLSLSDGILTISKYTRLTGWSVTRVASDVRESSLTFPFMFKKTNGEVYLVNGEPDIAYRHEDYSDQISLLGQESLGYYYDLYKKCDFRLSDFYQAAIR